MKKLISAAVSALVLGGACMAFGQDTGSSLASATPSVSKKDEMHPRDFEVKQRIKNQKTRVDQGLKDKTLSGEQAKACRDVIRSAEAQLKANKKEDLTEEQVEALNKILDANSSIIHEEKQESAASTATPAGADPAGTPSAPSTVTPSVPQAEEKHPRLYEVQSRIQNQEDRVQQGLKDKTLTEEQAKACSEIIKAAQTQLQADFAKNGDMDLMSDQVVELNTILDANSGVIHEEKQQSATATATTTASATVTPSVH